MKRILFVATIYRCGEKVYPIIPHLSKEFEVEVLLYNQMSPNSPWYGDVDLRQAFYSQLDDWGINIIMGPGNDAIVKNPLNPKIVKSIDFNSYDCMIVDDNVAKQNWGTPLLEMLAKDAGCLRVVCPHGNYEFDRYNLRKKHSKFFDYSFVFGRKEQRALMQRGCDAEWLLPGGIPANDRLKDIQRHNEYILIIPGYTAGHGGKHPYQIFTKNTLEESGALDIQEEEGCEIIIKEKSRFSENYEPVLEGLADRNGVRVIEDCEDNDHLVAGARLVIGSPSTLCFKSIQMGIPTILLRGQGMLGNFYDYKGLVKSKRGMVYDQYQQQKESGKDESFIRDTLEGGLFFTSTHIYVDHIERLLNER